jgi:hypothetical protein
MNNEDLDTYIAAGGSAADAIAFASGDSAKRSPGRKNPAFAIAMLVIVAVGLAWALSR